MPRDVSRSSEPQHRDHGAHRRRQDDDDRADPVLHRHHPQDRRGARGHRHHGLDGAGAGARHHDHLRRDHLLLEPRDQPYRINIIDTPGPRRLHHRGRALAARARRRGRGVRRASPASSRSPRRCGARPTSTACPRICFINKMDRVGADFEHVGPDASARQLEANAGADPAAARARRTAPRRHRPGPDEGASSSTTTSWAHVRGRSRSRPSCRPRRRGTARKLIEAVAELDDELMEKYLDGEADRPRRSSSAALRRARSRMKLFPVLCGSAFKNKGVQPLLDAVVDYLPSPLDIPPVHGQDPKTASDVERARPATTRRSRRWPSRS